MAFSINRRVLMAAGAALLAWGTAGPPAAQTPTNLRFSAVFSEQDIRAEMMKQFAEDMKAQGFTLEPYYGGTLFKQGTELVALQRGNLEMGNIAPQDISNQIPAWSILTSAYLFRDADHLKTVFASDVGQQMKKMAADQLGIQILGPTYFGTRQVGLKPEKKINTPADMAGIKLRMPGGDAWQFLGQSLGANPTPMAYAEVYTGPADRRDRRPGQPAAERAEHEVLRGDVADRADLAPRRLRPAGRLQQGLGRDVAGEAGGLPGGRRQGDRLEHAGAPEEGGASSPSFFKEKGLEVYTPDVDAFRDYAQKKYLASDLAKSWPEGMLDKINAM